MNFRQENGLEVMSRAQLGLNSIKMQHHYKLVRNVKVRMEKRQKFDEYRKVK
jgi:hypothetical protein